MDAAKTTMIHKMIAWYQKLCNLNPWKIKANKISERIKRANVYLFISHWTKTSVSTGVCHLWVKEQSAPITGIKSSNEQCQSQLHEKECELCLEQLWTNHLEEKFHQNWPIANVGSPTSQIQRHAEVSNTIDVACTRVAVIWAAPVWSCVVHTIEQTESEVCAYWDAVL